MAQMPAHTCVPTAKKVGQPPAVSSSCLSRCIHLLSSSPLRSHLHQLPTQDLPGAQALLCHTSAYSIAMCAAQACRPLSASRHAHSIACLRSPVLSAGSYSLAASGTFALAVLHPDACFGILRCTTAPFNISSTNTPQQTQGLGWRRWRACCGCCFCSACWAAPRRTSSRPFSRSWRRT